jgi:hypothetical protein
MTKISLQTANGQYVCAENGGGRGVVANRPSLGPWETFERIDLGAGRVALKAANGQYICAEEGGGREVVANRGAVGPWETFSQIDLGGGKVAFKTAGGQILCAEGGGGQKVVANRNAVGPWETFTIRNVVPPQQRTLTIHSVKCISPARGIDNVTRAAFGTLGAIAGAGVIVAGAKVTGGAFLAVAASAGISGASVASQAIRGLELLDGILSGTDDLYIKVNNQKVWPESQDMDFVAEQMMQLDLRVPFTGNLKIELMEYDSGSGDDSLGTAFIDTTAMTGTFGPEQLMIFREAEGSIYELFISVA